MVFAIDVLNVIRSLVVRAPPSSWLVDWFVELLYPYVMLSVGLNAARAVAIE
jgi:hypothetical protein